MTEQQQMNLIDMIEVTIGVFKTVLVVKKSENTSEQSPYRQGEIDMLEDVVKTLEQVLKHGKEQER